MSPRAIVRAVLIDDHPVFQLALRDLIAAEAELAVVGEATTCHEGLAMVAETKPDVAIVDVSLPSESGLALLPKLLAASPTTRVLMLTAHYVDEYAGAAIRAGATGFAMKTEKPAEIVRAIRTVARGDIFVSSFDIDAPLDGASESDEVRGYRRLTRREREVFILSVCGLSNVDTGNRLAISLKTVETHRASVNRKLGVHSSAELARFGFRNGMTRRNLG